MKVWLGEEETRQGGEGSVRRFTYRTQHDMISKRPRHLTSPARSNRNDHEAIAWLRKEYVQSTDVASLAE